MEKYKVVDYFDVWGNEKDGYEVNNLATIGEIELKDYTDKKEIIQALKGIDYMNKVVRVNMVEFYNDYEFIELFEKRRMKPFCRLELIRE